MIDESKNNFQLLYILLIFFTAIVFMALMLIHNKQIQQNEKDKKKYQRSSDRMKRNTLLSSRVNTITSE